MKRDELKNLVAEAVLDSLNEGYQKGSEDEQAYLLGQQYAQYDEQSGFRRDDIDRYSDAFQKGYKSVKQPNNQALNQKEYKLGQQYGVDDKRKGVEGRDVSRYSVAFQKGYKSTQAGLWSKVNNKITNWI